MSGFTVEQVAARATDFAGRTIGYTWTIDQVRDLRSVDRTGRHVLVSQEEMRAICEYAARCYNRRNMPSISEFCMDRDGKLPPAFAAPVPVAKQAEKVGASLDSNVVKELKALRREIDQLKSMGSMRADSAKLVEGPVAEPSAKARDRKTEQINKTINSFVFKEPISAPQCWTRVREMFERRNSIRVYLVGGQSFPQWLNHEDHLELFEAQLPGFLDYIHDELQKAASQPNTPQRELAL